MVSVVEKRMRRGGEKRMRRRECFLRDLGDDLLVEILVRLPSKTAVRCKAVCKKWCTLIGERGGFFIRRYIHHRHDLQVTLKCMSLVYQINSEYCVEKREWLFEVNIATENPVVHKSYKDGVVDMRFLPPCVQQPFPSIVPYMRSNFMTRSNNFRLEASCGELLLCSYQENTSTSTPFAMTVTVYYICNVATKKWVALPPIPTGPFPDVGFLCDPMPCPDCELEFNAHYNYKVVRIPLVREYSRVSELKIQIFCSKEGRWRNSTVSLSRMVKVALRWTDCLIANNRMLHRVTDDGVVAFDPFCESETVSSSRIIDLPPCVAIDSKRCYLGVSQGQLCLGTVEATNNLMLLVWELVDYSNVKWRLALRIRNVRSLLRGLGVKGDFGRLKIIAFHPYTRDILYLSVGHYIVKCNAREQNKSKVLHQVKIPCDAVGYKASWARAFPLVHHFWPTPVPAVP